MYETLKSLNISIKMKVPKYGKIYTKCYLRKFSYWFCRKLDFIGHGKFKNFFKCE